jgi:hypothetical protein
VACKGSSYGSFRPLSDVVGVIHTSKKPTGAQPPHPVPTPETKRASQCPPSLLCPDFCKSIALIA